MGGVRAVSFSTGLLAMNLHAATSEYLFTSEVSAEVGCKHAMERLKLEAIASRCGSRLAGGKLRAQNEQQDLLDQLYFESTAGYVTRYQEQRRQLKLVEPLPGESLFRCSVEAELEVACAQGQRDPQFAPLFEQQVALNHSHFIHNQEIVLSIEPRQPLFITVLQLIPYLQEEQRVWRLFPYENQHTVQLSGGQSVILPEPSRYRWVAQLPAGRERAVEELVVIATREPVSFPGRMSVEQFNRLLVEIPLSQRRELFIPYQITPAVGRGVVQ